MPQKRKWPYRIVQWQCKRRTLVPMEQGSVVHHSGRNSHAGLCSAGARGAPRCSDFHLENVDPQCFCAILMPELSRKHWTLWCLGGRKMSRKIYGELAADSDAGTLPTYNTLSVSNIFYRLPYPHHPLRKEDCFMELNDLGLCIPSTSHCHMQSTAVCTSQPLASSGIVTSVFV